MAKQESSWTMGSALGAINRVSLSNNLETRFQNAQGQISSYIDQVHQQNKMGTLAADYFDQTQQYKEKDFLRFRASEGGTVINGTNKSFKIEGSALTLHDGIPTEKYVK